jgi:hypothetical protein
MADEDHGAIDNKATEELLRLQFVAQNAPIHELAGDVAAMFAQLADGLDSFNKLATSEPCPCGLMSADIQELVIEVTMLSIHLAIYCMAIGERNPGGFHIAIGPAVSDLN